MTGSEAGFRFKQPGRLLLPIFCFIITSLSPVMTVIMALLLHIFTSLLRHYYVLIRLLLHHYFLNNGPLLLVITVIMDPLLL